MIADSVQRYGTFTRFLHWTMAVLVLLQFLKLGDRIQDGEHWIGQTIVPFHISIGILILPLVVIRLLWALSQRRQRPRHPGAIMLLVNVGHFLLYLSMFLLPLTGIAYMLGEGYGLTFFGIELAARSDEKIEWLIAFGSWHPVIAIAFVLLVVGHIGAALFHHFIRRDQTLIRMAG